MRHATALALALLLSCAPPAAAPSATPGATALIGASPARTATVAPIPAPTPTPVATAAPTTAPTPTAKIPTLADQAIQTGLAHPWDLAFAPDGRMFVTERAGNILIFESAAPAARRLASIAVGLMRAQGESGLMGIALDPAFARNGFLYVCVSRQDEGQWLNQVLRYRTEGNALTFDGFVIRAGMRAAPIHDGCRLLFGPDGRLFVTMGEAGTRELAQDPSGLNGKVLRVNTDGSIPADNPMLPGASARTAVWSYGHRNPQGLVIEPGTGRLFEIEHGQDDHDEINVIRSGGNYGWPTQAGPGGTGRGFVDPLWTSGRPTLATSGGTFAVGPQWGLWSGSLFVANLKEQDLRRFTVRGDTVTQAEVLLNDRYGRMRSVVLGPDGALYITTSNGGAGDRIIRLTATQ